MTGQNDVEVKIGADSGDLERGMREGTAAVSNGVRKMQGDLAASMSGMQTAISNLSGNLKGLFSGFLGIGAVIGIAKGVVGVASDFEALEIQLRAVMGSAEKGDQAFAWIKDFAVNTPYSVESTTKAFMQLKNFGLDPMDGTLKKVADASAKYGRDANAAERVTLALGQAWARGKLQGQDTLQMIDAGIPVYDLLTKATGKSAAELQKMSEKGTLTRDVMRKLIDEMGKSAAGTAEAKMRSLQGAISNMGDAYANALDDVRRKGGFQFITDSVLNLTAVIPDVIGVFKTLGDTIGSVLSEVWKTVTAAFGAIRDAISDVFGIDSGPMSAMQFFKNTLKVIQAAVVGFRVGVETVFASLKITLAQAANAFMTFGEVAGKAIKLDWTGAKAAYQKGVDDAKRIAQQGADDLLEIARKGRQDIDNVLLGAPKEKPAPAASTAGGDTGKNPDVTGPTDEQKKIAEEQIEFARKKAMAEVDAERDAITQKRKLREIDGAEESRQREALANRVFQIDREALQAKIKLNGSDKFERQKLNNELALLELKHKNDVLKIRGELVAESARLEQQSAEKVAEHNARLEQMDVDAKREALALKRDLGMISRREELDELRRLADEEYRIELSLLQKKLELYRKDAEAKAGVEREIVALGKRHAKDVSKINGDMQREQNQVWASLGDRISGLWDKGLQALMEGTLTWKNATRAVFADMVGWFASEVVGKKVKAWIAGEIAQTQATTAGVAARTAAGAVGATKNIMMSAWESMAGAYKAIVGIPIVGPVMAPVAAAGAFAAVASMARNVLSAEGGFDIPSGSNPLVQAHQKEMILPAKYADVIRGMAEGKGGAAGGNVTINIKAMDAKGVRDYFKKNSHTLAPAVRNMARNFTPVKA